MRRLVVVVGLVLVGLVVLKLSTGIGPSLPGPKVREILGLKEMRPKPLPCAARRNVRTPRRPRPASGDWRREPSSPLARSEVQGATLGGRIYLPGGQDTTSRSLDMVLAHDPARGRYDWVPPMPARVDHAVVAAHRGELYVAGGYLDGKPVNLVWRYSPESRRWAQLPSMRIARGGHAGGIIDGRLYVASGAPSTYPEIFAKPYDTLEVYDIAQSRWSFGPPIPTARHHTSAATLHGKLYVVGGRQTDDFSSSAFERFDPAQNRWERLPPVPVGAGGAGVTAASGEVLAIGGDEEGDDWELGGGWVTPAAWAFDPARSSWRRLPDLNLARHSGSVATLGGRVYVFEGSPCVGSGRTPAVESLDVRETRRGERAASRL